MKTNKVLTTTLILLIMSSLVSCGSDNASGDGSGSSTTSNNNFSNGDVINDSNKSDLQNLIENINGNRFSNPQYGTNSRFIYSSNACETRETSIFGIDFDYQRCTTNSEIMVRSYDSNGNIIRNTYDNQFSTNPATFRSELAALVESTRTRANSFNNDCDPGYYVRPCFYKYSNTKFELEPGDGYRYEIDLEKPLAANPTKKYDIQQTEFYQFSNEAQSY